jgi:hypothetical protein
LEAKRIIAYILKISKLAVQWQAVHGWKWTQKKFPTMLDGPLLFECDPKLLQADRMNGITIQLDRNRFYLCISYRLVVPLVTRPRTGSPKVVATDPVVANSSVSSTSMDELG